MIEKHLAHVSDEELGEAYGRTRFIEQRHEMAQAWADYLDSLAEHKAPPTTDGRSASSRNGSAIGLDEIPDKSAHSRVSNSPGVPSHPERQYERCKTPST
ncbi:hypothetical protein [Alcaligenes faecalis]|uniref:hypothetical protein n=1 Tax=Alcaligenes faecalis TaxID=511 RepID=UPI00215036F5|nr:hypothetical protein [Alcaligenes faecalis]MCR4142886.1 hypothetical protein [Alcaligenes faecalis]